MLKWGRVKLKGKCYIGANVHFDAIFPNLIEIGKGCIITDSTHILSHFYNTKDQRFYIGKVIIGDNVFIGMKSLIFNSVTIGPNAVIAAGRVVTKDIPSGELWGGHPTRFIKKMNNNL